MVSKGRGRLFKRTDGKYLIYLPVYLATDSKFPFKGSDSILVEVSFEPDGPKQLIVKPYTEPIAETE